MTAAKERYDKLCQGEERMISASEVSLYLQCVAVRAVSLPLWVDPNIQDNTMYLWDPVNSKTPVVRLTGHQKGIIFALYSPDGRLVVSCSFDKSAKLWDGRTGRCVSG